MSTYDTISSVEQYRQQTAAVERAETAWFVNEDGDAYEYPIATQRADYPDDFHTPYATREAAEASVGADRT